MEKSAAQRLIEKLNRQSAEIEAVTRQKIAELINNAAAVRTTALAEAGRNSTNIDLLHISDLFAKARVKEEEAQALYANPIKPCEKIVCDLTYELSRSRASRDAISEIEFLLEYLLTQEPASFFGVTEYLAVRLSVAAKYGLGEEGVALREYINAIREQVPKGYEHRLTQKSI